MPDIVVDTSEMADSLDVVASNLYQTAEAVEEMQRAVCEIEEESAQKICDNVNYGFFSLEHSQISQKKVMAMAKAEACLLGLRQSAQSLCRIKAQMARDFQRITSRYTKIFKSLNDALRVGIYAIDQPASTVSDREFSSIAKRITNCGSPLAIVQDEMLGSQVQLMVSRCKKHCLSLIENGKQLVKHNNGLQAMISAISKDQSVPSVKTKYLPILIVATDDLNLEDSESSQLIIGGGKYQQRLAPDIKSRYFEVKDQMEWTDCPAAEKRKISALIEEKIARTPEFDERTKALVLKLLNDSRWLTPGGLK